MQKSTKLIHVNVVTIASITYKLEESKASAAIFEFSVITFPV